jgi:hypothetical protein
MKLGRICLLLEEKPEGVSTSCTKDLMDVIGLIDLDNPKTLEEIAKRSYEDPEHPDCHLAVELPWDSLEPIDKAVKVEDTQFTLKALLALVKERILEESKK